MNAKTHNTASCVASFPSEDEDNCFMPIKTPLSYVLSDNLDEPPRVDTAHAPDSVDESIDDLVPDDSNRPYDMRDVV